MSLQISSARSPAKGALRPSAMLVGVTGVDSPRSRPDRDHAPCRTERGLEPGDEPAAADADDHCVGVRCVLLDLEPDRAGAGDHERVVERVHERATGLRDQVVQARERVGRVVGLEVDRRAVLARRFDLLLRRTTPHHDECVDLLLRCREGDGLRVVAGADRDHAVRALVGRQAADLVQRTAHLERAGALEELCFEVRAERRAVQHRRAVHAVADRDARPLDVVARRELSHAVAPPRRGGSPRSSRR